MNSNGTATAERPADPQTATDIAAPTKDPLELVPVTVRAIHPSGYEVTFGTTAARIGAVTVWLAGEGYRESRGYEYTPEGTPICPRHKVPMAEREKQGDRWYSHNVGTEENPIWCRGYETTNGPGWNVPR